MSNVERIRALRRAGDHEGACSLAIELAAATDDCELQYEAARVHDYLGREAQAIPFYLAAISGRLPSEQLRSAYLGLGSTYRVLRARHRAHMAVARPNPSLQPTCYGLRPPHAAELKR